MHLQVRSKLTDSGTGPGAQSASESVDGVTDATPGRLARLLWLLAQDRRSDPDDRHGPFNLLAAAGSNIETTGEFAFAVAANEADEDAEHAAALRRIQREFRRSWIVERVHADIAHREGELLKFVQGFADQGLLIDEVVVGVASCDLVDGTIECTVPVQVHAIRPHQP